MPVASVCALIVGLVAGSAARAQKGPVWPGGTDPYPGLPVGTGGWTVFTPSADTRIVYVSSSLGNNANGGTTPEAPKRTIAAGYALLRNGYPDWLVLKSGDTFNEGFPDWHKSGRSASEPMMVGSYGTGERPLLMTGTGSGFGGIALTGAPIRHIALTDIHFVNNGHTASGGGSVGINLLNSWQNFLVENCMIERYGANVTIQVLDPTHRPQNIRFRRCVIVDAFSENSATAGLHAQGFLIGATDGLLLEENVFDHNGWLEDPSIPGAVALIFSHNTYIQTDCTGVVVRGNISARAGSTGLGMRSGGLAENNLCLANPVNLAFGHGSLGLNEQRAGVMRHNVVLDSRNINGDPRGSGLGAFNAGGVEVYGNIVAHQLLGTGNVHGMDFDGNYTNLSVHDNIVYDWSQTVNTMAPALQVSGTAFGPVSIRNNILQQPNHGAMVEHHPPTYTNFTYAGQRYFTSNTGSSVMTWGTTYPEWVSASHETGSSFAAVSFPDAGRDIRAYMASLGGSGGLPEFIAQARLQSKVNWRSEFSAAAVNNYIRAGFGQPPVKPCEIDLNGNGLFDIYDFALFQSYITSGDLRGDLTHDGAVNMADVGRFLNLIAIGCP